MMSLGNTRNLTFRIISIIVTRFDYRIFIYILVLGSSCTPSVGQFLGHYLCICKRFCKRMWTLGCRADMFMVLSLSTNKSCP